MNQPVPRRRLSGVDAAFLYLERRELPLHIAAVSLFDGPLPFDEFSASIDSKLHLVPRYRQVVVPAPFNIGHPVWEDDPHFDVARHIFRAQVAPPGGQPELEELASRILSEPMDRKKPLWDIHVVEGLQDERGALLVRVHHSLADGIAGAALLNVIFDQTPEGSRPGPKPRFRAKPAQYTLGEALRNAIQGSVENLMASQAILLGFAEAFACGRMTGALESLIEILPELAAPVERLPFNRPCGPGRVFRWTGMDLNAIQGVRAALGGTVNDVLLTTLMRALARYVMLHGETVNGRLVRVVCPVNLRANGDGESVGNQITFMPVNLPISMKYPARHLRAVAARTALMKSCGAAQLVGLAAAWIGAAPPPLQAMFWGALSQAVFPSPLFNLIFTNIPGSPQPLYSAGRRMLTFYPHVPTGYELGINVAAGSYDGQVFFGFTSDATAGADSAVLRDLMPIAFEELCHSAGLRKASAKPPRARKTKPPRKANPSKSKEPVEPERAEEPEAERPTGAAGTEANAPVIPEVPPHDGQATAASTVAGS